MEERYVHFSEGPIGKIVSVMQGIPPHDRLGMKPRGLWFSVETADPENWGWKAWSESEGFQTERLRHATELIFHSGARFVRLGDRRGIRRFTERYIAKDHPANNLHKLPAPPGVPDYPRGAHVFALDWVLVANDYQGIVIAPYVWECRLNDRCFWYYSWDCACGCVWDATAIKEVRRAREFEEEVKRGVSDEVSGDGDDGTGGGVQRSRQSSDAAECGADRDCAAGGGEDDGEAA